MAGSVSVEVRGLNGTLDKLRLLVPAVKRRVRAEIATTALLIESDAKLYAPVDTGRLRSSIAADIAPGGLSASVDANVSYAVHVEVGTRFQRARPFLFPAYEKNRQRFLANLKTALKLF